MITTRHECLRAGKYRAESIKVLFFTGLLFACMAAGYGETTPGGGADGKTRNSEDGSSLRVSHPALHSFLEKNCFGCHGPDKQKGNYRFDELGADLSDLDTLKLWQGILDQLNLGEMPPKKAKAQPTQAEVAPIVGEMTSALAVAYARLRSTGRQAVIRRMNKFELRNTLRDLFYLRHPDFHPTVVSSLFDHNGNGRTEHTTIEPTRSFPDDEEEEGLDNIGGKLVMSDFLLDMILRAAEESISMASINDEDRPARAGYLGVQTGDAEGGVKILRVVEGTPAQESGIHEDDVITRVNGIAAGGPAEFKSTISSYREGDEVELVYLRAGREEKLKLKLGSSGGGKKSRGFSGNRKYTAPITTQGLVGHSIGRWQRELGQDYDEIFQGNTGFNRIGPDELYQGIGREGTYRITVELSGHNQEHPWGELLQTDQDDPFSVGFYLERKEHLRGPRKQRLAAWPLPGDGRKRSFSYQTYIDKTWTPWFAWENGPSIRHNVHGNLVKKYYPELYYDGKAKKTDSWPREMAKLLFEAGYKGPSIRVHSFTIELVKEEWPPKSHRSLYGKGPIEKADQRKLLLDFIRRAYRRPVEASEADGYLGLIRKMQAEGATLQEAMKAAYMAVLCSPEFIYIKQDAGRLDSYEIAERLSYFLWSSMPDARLFELAGKDQLSRPAVVEAEVERMLEDPRALAFTRHFPERWLLLHQLGRMEPDKKGPFRAYFEMKNQLVEQADLFFSDLLSTNGSIRNFIDSDYTFMNAVFDRHIYGQGGVEGNHLQKVALKDRRHGGIFTMPVVMTVTANGVDTSPIVRGAYVLENILGTPPPPPPPDVEPLVPNVSGTRTLKDELAAHRKNESCNSCHRKIDPMGFALEAFDPIGRIRTRYPDQDRKLSIDTSAVLPDGTKISDIVEFKQMLLGREELVYRCLVKKMLSYATGRMMEIGDRGEIDRVLAELAKKGRGLRDLVKLVVQSDIFTNK